MAMDDVRWLPASKGRRNTLSHHAIVHFMASAQTNASTAIKMFKCHVGLAFTQTSFVLGAVYFKYNVNHEDTVNKINPVVFAFVREAIAGCIMCTLAYLTTRSFPKRDDLLKLAFLGLLMYFNQLFYILGVELSGVVVATCMQPAIPVFTAALAMTLGKEEVSISKTIGILLASAGAICMVAGGGSVSKSGTRDATDATIGNILLVLNTVAMALYYVYAKPLLTQYPPMAVAAWAYVTAACIMGLTAYWYTRTYAYPWYLPEDAYGPLVYWIVICSVCGYYIIAWAMKHLPSTQVAAFQCLQPPMGSLLGFIILGEALTLWDFGALGVICGLVLVNRETKPTTQKAAHLPKIEVRKTLL